MYPQRPAASRGNAYPAPDALTGAKRDKYMMFGNFDCKNAGGERMTQVPDTSDDPSCFVQQPPAWPPGNTSPFPHIGAADYAEALTVRAAPPRAASWHDRRRAGATWDCATRAPGLKRSRPRSRVRPRCLGHPRPRQARVRGCAARAPEGSSPVGRGDHGRGRRVDVDRVVDVAARSRRRGRRRRPRRRRAGGRATSSSRARRPALVSARRPRRSPSNGSAPAR